MKSLQRPAVMVFAFLITLFLPACNYPVSSPGSAPDSTAARPVQTVQPPLAEPPSPTFRAPVPSTGGLQSCLPGTWRLGNVEGILTTILPAEVIDERQIRYQETSGEILYTFTGDGTVLVEAQDFRMTAAVDAGEIDLDLVVALDGTGSARYREDRHRGTLHLSDPNIDQVGIKATLGGISILQGIPIHYLVWFGSTDNQAGPIPYECGENTLSVTGPRIQKDTPPVTFILIRN